MLKKIEGPTYPASWDDHIAALIEREADGMEIAATHCLRAVGAGSKLRVWGHLESAIDALGQEFSVADLQEKYGQPYSLLGLHETARRFAAELGYCVGP